MASVSRHSRKEDLWIELERQTRSAEQERNRAAVLEAEIMRLRGERARLDERAKLAEELGGRARAAQEKLELLTSLTRELATFDLDGVLRMTVQRVPYLAGARCASLYLYEPEGDRLVLKQHTHGRDIDRVVELERAPGSLMVTAVRHRQVLCIDDLGRYSGPEGTAPERPHAGAYKTSSCIVAPLMAGGDVQGVLNMADRFDQRPFDSAEFDVVRRACDLVAVSIRNARLFEQVQQASRTDSLTGLPNHQGFFERLTVEVERARRYRPPLALLTCRLEGIGLVNANHGHQAGDAVIREAAHRVRRNIRNVDLAGRTGGSELGVILPEQLVDGAMVVARRLVKLLGQPFPVGAEEVPVRGVIGLAVYRREESASDLLRRAQRAAGSAREGGQEVGLEEPAPAGPEQAPPAGEGLTGGVPRGPGSE